jgi:GTP-binding protein LepA
MKPQFLDMMDLERERGITIKMQPVRMLYEHPQCQMSNVKCQNQEKEFYILNLIDTPGHVDFSYEVSRSLAAIEGVILLVDAAKGIQAQTLANLELAQKENLVIIPVINKIDLPQARIEEVSEELQTILGFDKEDIIEISAKLGTNVEKVLETVIKKVPPPKGNINAPLRALVFDSKYDPFLGVIAYIRIFDGEIRPQDDLYLIRGGTEAKTKEVGWFSPQLSAQNSLKAGEIGYVALGIKNPEKVRIGETITKSKIDEKLKIEVKPLPGYKESKPVVFTSIFPRDANDWSLLRDSLMRLKLNDSSLFFEPESKSILGKGFRCGFLGLLHAEITTERLKREFGLDLIVSSPSVSYKIITKDNKEIVVYTPKDWPHYSQIKEVYERFVELKIITPQKFLSSVLKLIKAKQPTIETLSSDRLILEVKMPLREIITGFYDKLKSVSEGYASMDYKMLGWEKSDLVKLEILIEGKIEENFSKIVPRKEAYKEGKKMAEKLKEVLPAQLFTLAIQARVEGRIIARRSIRARRKDVIAPLYGGDYTRKRKLLEKQKIGKKKLKERGQISIPPEVFWEIIKLD